MKVKIFKPARNAMQSGKARTKKWLLIPVEEKKSRSINRLMGWTSSDNTNTQLRMEFVHKEDAINFAKEQNFEYEVLEPEISKVKPKSYAANFTG